MDSRGRNRKRPRPLDPLSSTNIFPVFGFVKMTSCDAHPCQVNKFRSAARLKTTHDEHEDKCARFEFDQVCRNACLGKPNWGSDGACDYDYDRPQV